MRHSISARLCFVGNLNRVAIIAIYREWELQVKGIERLEGFVTLEGKSGKLAFSKNLALLGRTDRLSRSAIEE